MTETQSDAKYLINWFLEQNGFTSGVHVPHKWVLMAFAELSDQLQRNTELEATKNDCGAGAMCCYQASKLEAAEGRIAELEAQLEAAHVSVLLPESFRTQPTVRGTFLSLAPSRKAHC